ncbi:MAG: MarR family transcriptional regulator [Lachnospiraceae bacterium]|nr:MarR family transcriptional regulator [Lachnospiraceae bacterium]MDD3796617.1 MarR family transcriptional regulator [Lachnospiraceae bacterium]
MEEYKSNVAGAGSTEMENFFFSSTNVDRLFNMMERADYVFLYRIRKLSQETEDQKKVYLADLSENMHLSMPETSKAVQHLQDKNYLIWETDSEKQRTYVELTGSALKLMDTQRECLLHAYDEISSQISGEDLKQMLYTMHRVAEIIRKEIENKVPAGAGE